MPNSALQWLRGAFGSYFYLTGWEFPVNNTTTVFVNGQTLGTIPTDSNGNFDFWLSTSNADEGAYFVTASIDSVNASATTSFTLDINEPVHSQEGSGTTFDVPAGIAFTKFVFLPVILRE